MIQYHPLRTLGLLALASIAGIVGQLVVQDGWNLLFLGVMLGPFGYYLLSNLLNLERPPSRLDESS